MTHCVHSRNATNIQIKEATVVTVTITVYETVLCLKDGLTSSQNLGPNHTPGERGQSAKPL